MHTRMGDEQDPAPTDCSQSLTRVSSAVPGLRNPQPTRPRLVGPTNLKPAAKQQEASRPCTALEGIFNGL